MIFIKKISDLASAPEKSVGGSLFRGNLPAYAKRPKGVLRLWGGRADALFYCNALVMAAATEDDHDCKNDDPGAVVVKDVA